MTPVDSRSLLVARLAGDVTTSDSDRKLALVLPGGGLRGAWQIGALSQLEDLGLRHGFDIVVGSSAGGMNACYFASGQAHAGVSIYTDYLTGHALKHRFVDPKRFHKMMDIDWLVDVVLTKAVRLDTEALVRARQQVLVVVSNLRTGRPEVFDQHETELFQVLRATSALPVLYGRQPLVRGIRYSDGGLTAPSPIDQAVSAGATDIVVLSPSSRGQGQQPMGVVANSLTRLWLTHAGGPIAREVWNRRPARVALSAALAEGTVQLPGVHIDGVFADASVEVGLATTDRSQVQACARQGREDVLRWWSDGAV